MILLLLPFLKNLLNIQKINDDVQGGFLESFDSERENFPVNIVNKCPKPNLPIDISKPQESLNVTEMIEQPPSVYSTIGELIQLIEQELHKVVR